MKIKKLIELLQQVNPEAEAVICREEGELTATSIEHINVSKAECKGGHDVEAFPLLKGNPYKFYEVVPHYGTITSKVLGKIPKFPPLANNDLTDSDIFDCYNVSEEELKNLMETHTVEVVEFW